MPRKRCGQGYLEFAKSEASITATDATTAVLALGLLPIRITSQGARARRGAPDRPRQIEDLGRTGWEGDDEDGEPVSLVNDAVAYRSVVEGVRKFEKEFKPNGADIATDLCVLQCAGRIFGQPAISGTADASGCFNQFFVHPSELWKPRSSGAPSWTSPAPRATRTFWPARSASVAAHPLATGRNKQETDGSRHSTAPLSAQNALLRLSFFREVRRILLRLRQKKSAQSKRRNESYGRLKKGSRFLHWSQGKHGPGQSHNRLILLSLSADFNGSAQLQQFFATLYAGRFGWFWWT